MGHGQCSWDSDYGVRVPCRTRVNGWRSRSLEKPRLRQEPTGDGMKRASAAEQARRESQPASSPAKFTLASYSGRHRLTAGPRRRDCIATVWLGLSLANLHLVGFHIRHPNIPKLALPRGTIPYLAFLWAIEVDFSSRSLRSLPFQPRRQMLASRL